MGRYIGWARLIAFVLVLFALGVRAEDPIPLKILRNIVFDVYQQIKPREHTPFPIAILDVDDPSIAEIGQWPWPRTRFAELVEKATADGAVALAFDIVFSEPDRLSPAQIAADNPSLPAVIRSELQALPPNDEILANAFRRSRVIVGQTSVRSTLGVQDDGQAVPQMQYALIGPDPRRFLLDFPDLIENLPALEAAAVGRAMFNVRPDPDGVYRRAPLVMSVEDELRMGLGPELLRIATGGRPFGVHTNDAGVDAVILAGKRIRTEKDGTVRFYLTPSVPARYVSAADLLAGRSPKGRLQGHLVLVGTSAIGLEDYRATPLGVQMAGVEIHAQMLENIMGETLLVRPNTAIAVEIVGSLALCIIIIVLTPIMRASFLIGATLLFLTSLSLGSFILFDRYLQLWDVTFPILTGLASIMFMSAANYLREEQQRRRIRAAFGQYVSKDLVEELSENQESLKLGGESRELTLLFSDVQGFTAIAESYRDDPAGLTALMNQFLNRLSGAILDENGTIDKFMGDAVMAFWNAPIDHDDHQRAACRAALNMISEVEGLNRQRLAEDPGSPVIEVGIGINTGFCTVGNMGSDMRFDYTAMGDPVNLASRLEGQSRFYGVKILIGSSTAGVVRDDFALFELDLIRVKGKSEPERIFGLIGDAKLKSDGAFIHLQEQGQAFLKAWRAQDWERARQLLDECQPMAAKLYPTLGTYFGIMRERLEILTEEILPSDWDGVYDATSK